MALLSSRSNGKKNRRVTSSVPHLETSAGQPFITGTSRKTKVIIDRPRLSRTLSRIAFSKRGKSGQQKVHSREAHPDDGSQVALACSRWNSCHTASAFVFIVYYKVDVAKFVDGATTVRKSYTRELGRRTDLTLALCCSQTLNVPVDGNQILQPNIEPRGSDGSDCPGCLAYRLFAGPWQLSSSGSRGRLAGSKNNGCSSQNTHNC